MSSEPEGPSLRRDRTAEISQLLRQLSTFEPRVESSYSPPAPPFEAAVGELTTILQELQAANEELASAHQTIAQERQRYQDLFDFAPDGYLVTDRHGVIQEANRAAADLFSIQPRRLLRKPMVVFIAVDDRARFLTQLQELRHNDGIHEWEVRLQPRHRPPIPTACSVEPIRDAHEQIIGLRWLIRDISERKQAEEALRRSRDMLEQAVQARTIELSRANEALHAEILQHQRTAEERTRLLSLERQARQELEKTMVALRSSEYRFRRLFESNLIGIAFWDPNGPRVEANDAFLQIVGYTREDMVAGDMRWGMRTPHEYRHLDARADEEIKTCGVCTPFEKEYIRKDGSRVPVLIGMALLEGDPPQYVGFLVDLTERKRIEAELRTTIHEKEILLREVHHRVKNNLQIISSLLSLQADTIQDPRLLDLFRDSQHRVHAMALIHAQLYQARDLSRIDFADYIRGLATQVLQSYRPDLQHVILCLELSEVTLMIDQAVPCGLILNELMTNSLKYAFPDEQPGEIRIALSHESDQHIRLIVSDSGVGLPSDLDFQHTTTLGLQLVCALVEQLSGTITLDRSRGTSYTLTLPLHLSLPGGE